MREELIFDSDDSIAVIAPHPDDECLCAAAALIMAPERTDVYVISDGSHGFAERGIEEEAIVRKRQFDAEMDYVRPRRHSGRKPASRHADANHLPPQFGFPDVTHLRRALRENVRVDDFVNQPQVALPVRVLEAG